LRPSIAQKMEQLCAQLEKLKLQQQDLASDQEKEDLTNQIKALEQVILVLKTRVDMTQKDVPPTDLSKVQSIFEEFMY